VPHFRLAAAGRNKSQKSAVSWTSAETGYYNGDGNELGSVPLFPPTKILHPEANTR
jgi:hypothetical protein